MRAYLIKRLFLMIPTLFGISLVVFLVINIAPGSPTMLQTSSAGGDVATESVGSKESLRIFKRQWDLDKPILFNDRVLDRVRFGLLDIGLDESKVDDLLKDRIAGSKKDQMAADEKLENLWLDAVPHLITLLEKERKRVKERAGEKKPLTEEEKKRREEEGKSSDERRLFLIRLLAQNAQREVKKVRKDAEAEDFSEDQKEQLALNEVIGKEKARFKAWQYLEDKMKPQVRERLERNWVEWYRGKKTRYPATDKAEAIVARAKALLAEPPAEGGAAGHAKACAETLAKEHEEAAVTALVTHLLAHRKDIDLWARLNPLAIEVIKIYEPRPLDGEEEEQRAWSSGWREATFSPSVDGQRKALFFTFWKEWWEGTAPRFERTALEEVGVFFTHTRFANYMARLAVFDFGDSIQYKGERVIDLIEDRLKVSITFAILGFLISYTVSIPIGIYSAVYKDSVPDRFITVILFMLYALPSFYVGTILLIYLASPEHLTLFPTGGFQDPEAEKLSTLDYILDIGYHMVLPILCYTYASFATLSRYARAGLLEVIRSDYVRTARAKGLSERVVILKHALRNGVIPILTMVGGILPALIGGSVIIESIFNINGMGKLMIDAIFNRDYNVVMADSLIAAFLVLCGILVSDITYVLVDPRISFD